MLWDDLYTVQLVQLGEGIHDIQLSSICFDPRTSEGARWGTGAGGAKVRELMPTLLQNKCNIGPMFMVPIIKPMLKCQIWGGEMQTVIHGLPQ
jgi:hypothetical protein